MPGEVAIVSCGMMTPVGLSAAETDASTRSRTARLGEISWHDQRFQPFVVGTIPEEGLPDLHIALRDLTLTHREQRMLRLADLPVREALAPLSPRIAAMPCFLGLPELQTKLPLNPSSFVERLGIQADLRCDAAHTTAMAQGRAAGLFAIHQALEVLTRRGAEFALVGGVESYIDPYVLGMLDVEKRVRSSLNSDGFVPSEGAGFLLLSSLEACRKRSLKPLSVIVGSAIGHEDGHLGSDHPYRGDGLAETFTRLFDSVPGAAPVGSIYASLNGERYWAKELGVAILRNKGRFADDFETEHPAECLGDLGAAHGPVLVGLAALALQQGYRRSPALVYSSSDFGDRAALLLEEV